eukprot:g2693.t1
MIGRVLGYTAAAGATVLSASYGMSTDRIKKSTGWKPADKTEEAKPVTVADAVTPSASSMSFREKLKELTEAHRDGLLNKDEFEGAKKDVVDKFLSR